jgi:RHH-type proline utilization regulon transcriptional repressor/proline dehydrogenase/delta 1-pyrroline-5-carboxylate dehydrogenase
MEFKDIDWPSVGAIQSDHTLLRLVSEWKQKLTWGQLSEFRTDLIKTIRAVKSYLLHWEQEFSQEKDYFHLRGQDNIVHYLPVGSVVVRIHPDDRLFDVLARIAAVKISGCTLAVSLPKGLDNQITDFLKSIHGKRFLGGIAVKEQSDRELIAVIPQIQRIRYAAPDRVPYEVSAAAADTGFYISRIPVMMEGRIELLQYFQEQSVCNNYHRYGNLGERALM